MRTLKTAIEDDACYGKGQAIAKKTIKGGIDELPGLSLFSGA